MKTPMERFEEDYVAVQEPCSNRKGFKVRYVYYGPWYLWKLEPEDHRKVKKRIGTACILGAVLFLISALQYSAVNTSILTSAAGALSLVPFLFEVIGVVHFCTAGERMTRPDYQDINWKLRVAAPMHGALVFVTAVSGLFYSLYTGLTLKAVLISAGYFLASVCIFDIYVTYRQLRFTTKPNEFKGENTLS